MLALLMYADCTRISTVGFQGVKSAVDGSYSLSLQAISRKWLLKRRARIGTFNWARSFSSCEILTCCEPFTLVGTTFFSGIHAYLRTFSQIWDTYLIWDIQRGWDAHIGETILLGGLHL
jgi:hypothetical protein